MNLAWREASEGDLALLAEWNHQLIRDEGHRNPMSIAHLSERMKKWLEGEYRAVIFLDEEPVSYALFKKEEDRVHLGSKFFGRVSNVSGAVCPTSC